jgi:NAD(P)H dehydrogenase (quinone)
MARRVKLSIIYYSSTGTIHRIATAMADAAGELDAEVRLRRAAELAPRHVVEAKPAWAAHADATAGVPVVTADDVLWADAVVFGTPSRFGNIASQLKQFVDTLGPLWLTGRLADKVYSAFTSGSTPHGGMETTLVSVYNMVYHFGGVVVPPGAPAIEDLFDRNPYGTSHVLGRTQAPVEQSTLDSAAAQAGRVVTLARALTAVPAFGSAAQEVGAG